MRCLDAMQEWAGGGPAGEEHHGITSFPLHRTIYSMMTMTMAASTSMRCCTAQYPTAALQLLRCSPSSKPAEAPCRHRRAWPRRYSQRRSIRTAPSAMLASTSTSTPSLSLHSRPLRLAIIGAGPAGFYAAARLFGLPGSDKLRIDMYEELPVPFGLVRYGVAPDHPEVKVRAQIRTR